MVAWTTALTRIVPRSAHIAHWRATWVGFDVGLAVGLGATAAFVARNDPRADHAFAALAALLTADAWFDTMTAQPGRDRKLALALAALVEIPTAAVCTLLALHDGQAPAVTKPGCSMAASESVMTRSHTGS